GDLAVLLGHTASDQAETVLMRLLRGAGPGGVAGIPARRGRYFRPLLGTTRAEIERYLTRHALEAIADPMNSDPRFLRTGIREKWLPALRAENPQLDAALCRMAERATEVTELLDYAALALRAQAKSGDGDRLAVAALAAAPAAVAKRAISQAAAAAGLG